jgi:hypothetical protein
MTLVQAAVAAAVAAETMIDKDKQQRALTRFAVGGHGH